MALMGERANREGIQNGVTPRQILEAEVANFIFAHHQKASAGDIPGMVSECNIASERNIAGTLNESMLTRILAWVG